MPEAAVKVQVRLGAEASGGWLSTGSSAHDWTLQVQGTWSAADSCRPGKGVLVEAADRQLMHAVHVSS